MLGFKRPVRSLFPLAFTVIVGNIGVSLSTSAAIVNGEFEDPLTLGWQVLGDTTNIGSLAGGPTQGSSQAVLSNAANSGLDDATNLNYSGNNVTNINSLESFLGLSLGSLTPVNSLFGAIEGSALQQTFSAIAGQTLSLEWNFLTNDITDTSIPGFEDADYSFIALQSSGGSTQIITLADTSSPLLNSSSSSFSRSTGFQNYSTLLSTTGNYTLSFGVVDVGNSANTSALLLDNIQLSSSPQATPETNSIVSLLLLGMGLGIAGLAKSQK